MTNFSTAGPEIAQIQAAVCSEFRLSTQALLSAGRGHHVSHPRQIAIWLTARLTPVCIKAIAAAYNRDRATVFHAINAVDQHIQQADHCGTAALKLYQHFTRQNCCEPSQTAP